MRVIDTYNSSPLNKLTYSGHGTGYTWRRTHHQKPGFELVRWRLDMSQVSYCQATSRIMRKMRPAIFTSVLMVILAALAALASGTLRAPPSRSIGLRQVVTGP